MTETDSDWLLLFLRELWEVKQQREELARDVVRKDAQVKEMQQRLESGEGCKLIRTQSALDPTRPLSAKPPPVSHPFSFDLLN